MPSVQHGVVSTWATSLWAQPELEKLHEGCSVRCGAEPAGRGPRVPPGLCSLPPACCWMRNPIHLRCGFHTTGPKGLWRGGERCSQVLQSLPTSPARSQGEPRTRSSCPWPFPACPGPRAPRIPAHHSPTAPSRASPAGERSLVGSELLSSRSRGWEGPSWRSSGRLRPKEGLNRGPTAPRSPVAAGLVARHVMQRRSPQLLRGHRVQQPHPASGPPNNALLSAGKHR